MRRKCGLVTGEVYHIFTKSIAGYIIFNKDEDFQRMLNVFRYYQPKSQPRKFSDTVRMATTESLGLKSQLLEMTRGQEGLVQIIAYCVMPTHLHLVLKQKEEYGIETYMRKALNSYAKHFNTLHKRKGPLWEGRFKNVRVETDEQLLHLTRYVHLNPVTAYLTEKPEAWPASSYTEYLAKTRPADALCDFKGLMNVQGETYRRFVEDRISYQRDLAKIKDLILE